MIIIMRNYSSKFTKILIILLHHKLFSLAGFVETPSSMMISVGTRSAIFRCHHTSLEATIGWSVNGSSIRAFPDITSNSTNENGTQVYTLTIPTRSEYNGTVVICIAFFFNGSQQLTTAATLIITANELSTTTAAVSSAMTMSTVQSITTTSPLPLSDFTMLPSSLNVTTEQQKADFHCQHRRSDDITWRVNGMSPSSPNISIEIVLLNGGGVRSSLSISTLPSFNETAIECVAIFFQGSPPFRFTSPVTLLIQDTPGRVLNSNILRNYSSVVLTTIWDPIPSLDLTDIDPDIVYNVELFKITCDQNVPISHQIVSERSSTKENLDLMQIYKAVITAKNNVAEAINGSSVEIREKFISLDRRTVLELAKESQTNVTSNMPVPFYYTMITESLDNLGHNLIININVRRSGEVIHMTTEEALPSHTLWNVTILPYGCKADNIVDNTELSTHDIQNIIIDSPQPSEIRVRGHFIDQATATGVLLIVYSYDNDLDVHYHAIDKHSEQDLDVNVTGLIGPKFGVSLFALEDGLPFPRVVTTPKSVSMHIADNQGRNYQPVLIEYGLIHTSAGVCITCTFLDSSTTDCVAVVHQRISQLSSSGLMNIESSHKFNRSRYGDTAYGCIEGVNLEQYQIGVIEAMKIMPMITNYQESATLCVRCISIGAGIALSVLVILLGVAVFTVICLIKRCFSTKQGIRNSQESTHAVDTEMQNCEAYDIVRLSQQKVTVKDNPAYVDVNLS